MLLELAVNGGESELVELSDRDGQKILDIVENAQLRRRVLSGSLETQIPRVRYGHASYLESAFRRYIYSDLYIPSSPIPRQHLPVKNWGIR